ncbi:hypothetical protein SCHPADRAFT_884583 [Schizopora paradoxa]|uniref:Uncharacterized protein n=1 Tax=Schizopora paradoxa TaxID=27342 RepID=A0A0H2S8B9_9AGAM|nr:hypothetical protein SCHPADRAFT_884583 [Schizopora paradoxa]
MATVAAAASFPPSFNGHARRHAPSVSSPLSPTATKTAFPSSMKAAAPPPSAQPKSTFTQSRALRPFASIAQPRQGQAKPVKMIEPPASFSSGVFVLNLTQKEFSRQD